jgi:hypothetical protein
MQKAGEKFSDRGWWVGLRVECVFPRNLPDSKMVILYTIPRYGINESSLFMLFHPWAGFPGIEYQFYGSGKARNHRRDQRQSIHSPFLDAAAFAGTDPARSCASSCQLRSGVSPVPKSEGPGAPSVWFLGRRDRGHPPPMKDVGSPRCPRRPVRTPFIAPKLFQSHLR